MIASLVIVLGLNLPNLNNMPGHSTPTSPIVRYSPTTMTVVSVESTPNPSAFLLKLDAPLQGVSSDGLRGQTFRKGRAPESLAAALATDGVSSVFVVKELLTISKEAAASWESVLPPVVEALGGAGEALAASGSLLPSSTSGAAANAAPATGGVAIRLQVSQKMPIQIEASGWSGKCPPVRAKLSARFGSAMALLIDQSGDAFFKGRAWLPRGLRYPELADDDEDAEEAGSEEESVRRALRDPSESERTAIAAALESELAEVEAAFPDDRLAALVHGSKAAERRRLAAAEAAAAGGGSSGSSGSPDDRLLSLEMVDELMDDDAAIEATGEAGRTDAMMRLCAFVATGRGVLGARRNAIAYLGGTAGRGGDAVFDVVAGAFKNEKAAGLRRTAGDALSDLGDARAAPLATSLLADRSTLVRWRAARILGELGEGAAVAAALKQAQFEEKAFECAFEMKDAARKVAARNEGRGGDVATGPMWKQIQEGMAEGEA